MALAHRLLAWAAWGLVVAAAVVVLWPLHATGVDGSAERPHYRAFGFATFEPLPARPTPDDLRRAGVRLPRDVVDHRRHIAEGIAWAGLALAVGYGALGLGLRRVRTSGGRVRT